MDRRLKMLLLAAAFYILSGLQGNAAPDNPSPGHMVRDGSWYLSGEAEGKIFPYGQQSGKSSLVSQPEGMT